VSIRSALFDSAVDLGDVGKDTTYGYGVVDAAGAVRVAARTATLADTTPPEVAIDAPRTGARFSERFIASATVTDDIAVVQVALAIDGVPFAVDPRRPYRFVVDPAAFTEGWHDLTFVASDVAGNTSSPEKVDVFFSASLGGTTASATEIGFKSPADGATVSGNVSIEAIVSDADRLATVEWFVDGDPASVGPLGGETAEVAYLWRTAGVSPGRHEIALVVTDSTGEQTTSRLTLVTR
jgi:hypothetical protein